ncbi:aldehyde dehydrogenase (NAD+) [Streptomyces sp. TLI_235]|nr:aldehyde dehydrogenase family protein [Streptomyces sp. TLI_235]PBC76463.1 aldehyde dehydrogenase (NAD+) [Streptomyces sp. TLI_235]
MTVTSYNPADPTDLVATVDTPGAAGTRAAVDRARAAQPGWYAAGAAARAAALGRAADAVENAVDELAALAAREVGKPLAEARGEAARAVAILRYYAQAPYAPTGAVHDTAAGPGLLLTRRRPHGVAGLVTPWNFPLAIPVWKAAPALAVGNTAVLKPAPEATGCALRLAELLDLAEGVLTVVPGGAEEGAALVDTADVVSFTGSTAVGQAVIAATAARGIPAQAELGGLNAALVLPDADIEQAADHLAAAVAGYAGQKCTATGQVIAVGAAYEPLREALAKRLAAAERGPVIGEAALERLTGAVDSARAAGASVLTGGGRTPGPGWGFEPALLADVPAGHPLRTEEYFGPIAVLLPAADLDEAIALANAGRHTLAASVHTRDLDTALAAADRLAAGMIRINAPTTGVDFHLPFGGTGSAGWGGREQGAAALEFYTASRTVTLLPSA